MQYLYFYLKRKNVSVKEFKPIDLMELSTTPANALTSGTWGYTAYNKDDGSEYGYYRPVTEEMIDETRRYYEDEIKEYKEDKANAEKDYAEAKELFVAAKGEAAVKEARKIMNDARGSITWYNEQIEENERYLNMFIFAVQNVWFANKEQWEVVYTYA